MTGRKRLTQRVIDERQIDGGRVITLTFRADEGPSAASPVPAVLRLPAVSEPVPAALLLHGYASRKEDMAESAGEELVPLDLPDFPLAQLIRSVADPLRGVRALAGRPLLMVHGRRDRTILPAQAERLFAAAEEPKEIQWWDAGHYLPIAAVRSAAEWLARTLRAARAAA